MLPFGHGFHREMARRAAAMLVLTCVFALMLSATIAAAHPQQGVDRTRVLMGSPCRIQAQVADPAVVEAALDSIARVEDELSTWRSETPLSRLNAAAGSKPVGVSPSLLRFLLTCREWSHATHGAFDPIVGALVDAWDLRGAGRVPDAAALRKARARSGIALLEVDEVHATARLKRAGAWLDSGGIAKGLALDVAAQELRTRGVSDAILDFGGQILVLGTPPEAESWPIAIADPRDRERPGLVLALRDASAATSEQSERGVEVAGQLIGHVLDPRTGRPVPTDASVTAIAPSAQDADILSTALLVMGSEAGLQWIQQHPGFEAGYLIPRRDQRVELRASPGFLRLVTSMADDVVVP